MDVKKFLVNDKITASCQINMSPKHYLGQFSLSGKLPTHPSPKPTLTLTSRLGQNFGLGEG